MFKVSQFYWRGKNRFGVIEKGKCLGESRQEIEQRLVQKGFSHIRISRNILLFKQPKQQEITQLLNQFALLVKSRIPLKTALHLLQENSSNPPIYLWIKSIIQYLESGYSLSQALSKEAKYLHPQEIQLIQIGETSGQLATILCNIASARINAEKLTQKVKKILFYPVLILTISLVLTLLLLLFIVPKFAELYSTKQQSLPLLTKLLFSSSQLLKNSLGEIIFLLGVSSLIALWLQHKTDILHRLKFKIFSLMPIWGTILRQSRTVFFCQNSAIMLNAHIRIDTVLQSFITTPKADPNLTRSLTFALERLKQGYPLHESLSTGIFENDVIRMIEIGEKSGNLAEMLQHIGDNLQQRLDYQIDLLSQLIEPLMMLVLGAIVGVIMVGLYLPIFDMGGMIE